MTAGPIVVMGVSGAGKSEIAAALAQHLGVLFVDADDLHAASNKLKMAAGHSLTDEDRLPWLDEVGRIVDAAGSPIVACSALRRRYRERLLNRVPRVRFLELVVSRPELERRLAQRSHEFMPPKLLDSQLETLEYLEADEPGVRIDANSAIDDVVASALSAITLLPF